MNTAKYHVGQIVYFTAPILKHGAPSTAHRVERHLPTENGQRQYRVKAVDTGRERVAQEEQLSGRTTVEALAQSLYEAGNSTNIPWARRDRTVREPWLREAHNHLAMDPDKR